MTWGNPDKFIHQRPTKKAAKLIAPEQLAASGTEDGHQAALFCWSALNVGKYPQLKWLHSIPNGGSRHIAEATKMVAGGLRSGVLDIFLPLPIHTKYGGQYAGAYIEMKVEKRRKEKNGGLTDEQIEFIEYCNKMSYYVKVCYSWIEARDCLIKYLNYDC
jgi:hypothetical protein